MSLLEVEPLDLGADVRAMSLTLTDGPEQEPLRGAEAAKIWSRVIPALAAEETWALDFFSHADRVREFCEAKKIPFRDASKRSVVISPPSGEPLEQIFARFERETFGARAGAPLPAADPDLESELAHRGVDAYHAEYSKYAFCAICEPEDASLVILSKKLWASEIARRLRPALAGLEVTIRLAG
jgi:hypothetical protein